MKGRTLSRSAADEGTLSCKHRLLPLSPDAADRDNNSNDSDQERMEEGSEEPAGGLLCLLAHPNFPTIFIMFLASLWLGLGLAVFATGFFPMSKEPSVVNAVYLCVQILTTVGYGDFTPQTPSGQIFTSFYAIFALVLISGILSELLDFIITQTEDQFSAAMAVVQARIQGDSDDLEPGPQRAVQGAQGPSGLREKGPLLISLLSCASLIFASTVFYAVVDWEEGMTTPEAFYLSCITLTTVGFGDFCPSSSRGKLFSCAFMMVGVALLGNLITRVTELILLKKKDLRMEGVTKDLLREMDESGDGKVDKYEFLKYVLLKYKLVKREQVDSIMTQFDLLDGDHSGFLDMADLEFFR